ncbi:MAG: hypothetical protein QOJ59_1044 [Thermomicrobiales bacterium]|jgi:hypothetical protein|nr:hypothetical protein [Thermomicrobiales bacterium]
MLVANDNAPQLAHFAWGRRTEVNPRDDERARWIAPPPV